jgi:hypothetical protein
MKTFCSVLLSAMFIFNATGQSGDPKTYYYFCVSRAWSGADTTRLQYVLYTDIKEITCDEAYFPERAKQWRALVDKECKNSPSCTSDVNYYPTRLAASERFEKMLKRYGDTTRYESHKLDF